MTHNLRIETLRFLAEHGERSSMQIGDHLSEVTGRDIVVGAYFAVIIDLKDAGQIVTRDAPGGPERGYHNMLMCAVTDAGRQELYESDRRGLCLTNGLVLRTA